MEWITKARGVVLPEWRSAAARGFVGWVGLLTAVACTGSGDGPSGTGTSRGLVIAAPISVSAPILPDLPGIEVATTGRSSIAFDGVGYLALFSRPELPNVYVTRIDVTGALIDRTGIPLSGRSSATKARLSYVGGQYVAVWLGGGSSVWGIRLASDRTPSTTFPISLGIQASSELAVSGDGSGGALVACARPDFQDMVAVLWRADGTRGSAFAIAARGAAVTEVAASHGAGAYLISWSAPAAVGDGRDIIATRVSAAGVVIDATPLVLSNVAGGKGEVSGTFDGTNHIVTWSDRRSGDADIYSSRVSPEGRVLDSGGVPIRIAPDDQTAPAVVSRAADNLIFWRDRGSDGTDRISGVSVSKTSGTPPVTVPRTIMPATGSPAAASDGSDALVVVGGRAASWNAAPNAPVPGVAFAAVPDFRDAPTAISAPGGALLRWQTSSGTHWRRVAPDGSWIDPADLTFPPKIAALDSDGVGYLAVTLVGDPLALELQTAHLSAVGTMIGQPVVLKSLAEFGGMRSFADAQVAYQGGAYFLLWSERVVNLFTACGSCWKSGTLLGAARVSGGVVAPTSIPSGGDQHGLVVAGARGFGVLWSSTGWQHFPPPGFPRPYANRWMPTAWRAAAAPAIGPATLGPAMDLPPPPVIPDPWPAESEQRYNDQPHTLVSDGESYLLLWLEGAVLRGQLRRADLSAAGDAFEVSSAPGAKNAIAGAFTGAEYLVAWTDSRQLATSGTDVFGARVSVTGLRVDLDGFPIAAGPGDQSIGSLVGVAGNRVLVTYRSVSTQNLEEGNVLIVTLPSAPDGGVSGADGGVFAPDAPSIPDAGTPEDAALVADAPGGGGIDAERPPDVAPIQDSGQTPDTAAERGQTPDDARIADASPDRPRSDAGTRPPGRGRGCGGGGEKGTALEHRGAREGTSSVLLLAGLLVRRRLRGRSNGPR